ncbi:MAG: acetyltransferase [Pseudomonadota bacterium]
MKRLMIIGAGGFGREMLAWLEATEKTACYEASGFLDKNSKALDGYGIDLPILGDPDHYQPKSDDLFICAFGNTREKLRICRSLKARGGQFATFIHPTAVIGKNCSIGEGSILCPGAVVTSNVRIGSFVTLNVFATVGHDAVIGDGSTLSGHCDVTGFAFLGEGVFMGSHAAVLPGAVVGDYAVIGAGSVVLKKAAAKTTVFGVPARCIADFSKEGGSGGWQ